MAESRCGGEFFGGINSYRDAEATGFRPRLQAMEAMKRPQRITPSQSTSDKAAAAFRRGPGSAARPGTRASTQSGWRRSSTAFTTAAARRASFTRKTGVVAYLVALTAKSRRSEEHTSELQSLMRISYAVFCLQQKKQQ